MTQNSVGSATTPYGLPVPFPVDKKYPITCDYGVVGDLWRRGWHARVDIGCPVGTPVKAVYSGVVHLANFNKNLGESIWILSKHPILGQFRHNYAHNLALKFKTGDPVVAGELISLSGNSGVNIKGEKYSPHLCFGLEFWPSRKPIRPVFI